MHIKGHNWGKENKLQNVPAPKVICKMEKTKTEIKDYLCFSTLGTPHIFVPYLQEVDQVLTVKNREKSPCGWQEERKRSHFEIHQSTLFVFKRSALRWNYLARA